MDHKEAVAAFANYLMDNHTQSSYIFIDLDALLKKSGYRLYTRQTLSVEKQEKS